MLNRLLLYYHTVKYLKWTQVKYQLFLLLRRKLYKATFRLSPVIKTYPEPVSPDFPPIIFHSHCYFDHNTFEFLNQKKTFDEEINWNFSQFGKLWTYNLNYFEFLHQANFPRERGMVLINDFIQNSQTLEDGLEPFPTSLRIINWIKFLCQHTIKDQRINQSLYQQIHLLSRNLEYHLLGNHLLENAFALLFGAIYFNDGLVLKLANKLLIEQLEEQVLEDGAHFELSPMYHQLMLFRILDCINFIQNSKNQRYDPLLQLLKNKAAIMLGWLEQMTFMNGQIPLFNDAANGISPSSKELQNYSKKIGVLPMCFAFKSIWV